MLGRTMLNSEIHLSKATQERDRIYRSDQEEGHIRERDVAVKGLASPTHSLCSGLSLSLCTCNWIQPDENHRTVRETLQNQITELFFQYLFLTDHLDNNRLW